MAAMVTLTGTLVETPTLFRATKSVLIGSLWQGCWCQTQRDHWWRQARRENPPPLESNPLIGERLGSGGDGADVDFSSDTHVLNDGPRLRRGEKRLGIGSNGIEQAELEGIELGIIWAPRMVMLMSPVDIGFGGSDGVRTGRRR